jgi:hypothetical protein
MSAVAASSSASAGSTARKGLAKSILATGLTLIFLLGVLSRLFLTFRYEWYEVNEVRGPVTFAYAGEETATTLAVALQTVLL